jgi:hypothetical protein
MQAKLEMVVVLAITLMMSPQVLGVVLEYHF